MNKQIKRISLLVSAALLLGAESVLAAVPVTLPLNSTKYMTAPKITRIAVGNPEIADINLLSNHDFLLVGKKAGTTSLIVWSGNGVREEYSVYVSGEDQGQAKAIQEAIGIPGVQVQMMNGKVLIRGKVKNQYDHDTAMKIAQLYTGSSSDGVNNVVDLMDLTHPTQVRLEAQIIEINADDEKNLGIQFWTPALGDSTDEQGPVNQIFAGEDFVNSRGGTLGWLGRHVSNINATVQALVSNGKAKILSRPSITTMSGQKADILIGGRIPIPTADGDGKISVDWREYGVRLNIEPVVDAENKITSKVHAEVSTLDYGHGVTQNGFVVPALASREADAVINVRSGMTMAIGGLLNSEDSKTVTKVPLLGDLPIIGQFFRHTSNTRDKREMIILITPTLVSDDSPVGMSQQMKGKYEEGERYVRNAEKVDVNKPTEPGTAEQERDVWGDDKSQGQTVVVEKKQPVRPDSHILKTRDSTGHTVYVPLSAEDYAKNRNKLQVVSDREGVKEAEERQKRVDAILDSAYMDDDTEEEAEDTAVAAEAQPKGSVRSRIQAILSQR
ncbi:type II and III secretion system protein family protein [Allisonella histaminiformans]|uniref:type II and III secretion system protein family protein n=1 Tax=Allisonella histaminiformans TaxID=209880 RepID=UPI003F8B108F